MTVQGTSQLGPTEALASTQPNQYPWWQIAQDTWGIGNYEGTGQVLLSREGTYSTASANDPTYLAKAQGQVKSLTDAVGMLYQYPEDKLADLTRRMYAAGMYPPQSYAKGAKPPTGKVMDDFTRAAAINLFQTVVSYQGQKSVGQVLDEFSQAGVGQDKIAKAQQAQGAGHVYNVTTDDPATLRASVTKTAQALLGRDVSDQESDALVKLMIEREKAPQQAAITAGTMADTGSDVTLATARVDAEAQLSERLKAQNPTEASAYSELNYYNVLHQALKGAQ